MGNIKYVGISIEKVSHDFLKEAKGDYQYMLKLYVKAGEKSLNNRNILNAFYNGEEVDVTGNQIKFLQSYNLEKKEFETFKKEIDLMRQKPKEYGIDLKKIGDYDSLCEQIQKLRSSLSKKSQSIYNGNLINHNLNPVKKEMTLSELYQSEPAQDDGGFGHNISLMELELDKEHPLEEICSGRGIRKPKF